MGGQILYMIHIITERNAWQDALQDIVHFDFYHTYDYHQSEKHQDDLSCLIHYEANGDKILLPLILRNLEQSGDQLQDATSVYGYAGPLARCNHQGTIQSFATELSSLLKSFNVVSLFTRLHPVLENQEIISSLGSIEEAGSTISIDLTEPVDIQRMKMRRETKYKLNKLRKAGVECHKLDWTTYGQEFISIYEETMHRLNASKRYFFPEKYYHDFF